MKPRQLYCCECGKKRDEYRPVMKLINGLVHWCCRQCWKRLDYDAFMYQPARLGNSTE